MAEYAIDAIMDDTAQAQYGFIALAQLFTTGITIMRQQSRLVWGYVAVAAAAALASRPLCGRLGHRGRLGGLHRLHGGACRVVRRPLLALLPPRLRPPEIDRSSAIIVAPPFMGGRNTTTSRREATISKTAAASYLQPDMQLLRPGRLDLVSA